MPIVSRRAKLELSSVDHKELLRISRSRTESAIRILRANILLRYVAGQTISAIAREMRIDRPRVNLAVSKSLSVGAIAALDDLPRSRPVPIVCWKLRPWVTMPTR